MPIFRGLPLLFLLALSGCASLQDAPPTIIGKWTWTLPANNCREVYEFRASGWLLTQSALEHTESTYTATEPDSNGYITISRGSIRDFGGIDCADSEVDNTGQLYTSYARLSPRGDELYFCATASPEKCFGPLTRLPDVETLEVASQSGAPLEIEFWYAVNPDCSSRGDVKIRITQPPQHGKLELIDGWGYATFPEGNLRHECNRRGVTGRHGYYRATRGFSGRDSITVEALFPDGAVTTETWNIAVWPSPAKRIAAPEPAYPESFRGRGIEGKVVAVLSVDSSGNVTEVSIIRSRLDEFSRAFAEAARQWKFEPPSSEHTTAIYYEQVEYDFLPQ